MSSKKTAGPYKEYDCDGKQTAEIPFEKGEANGIGWVLQDGFKFDKKFRKNACHDLL